MLKHFGYITTQGRGRLAVALHGDRITIKHLAGYAPPAQVLPSVLALLPEVLDAANAAATTRRNGYAVQIRNGMSGSRDYMLRECRDADLGDFPIRARIHVSMYGKLNEAVSMWIGDLPPLLAALCAGFVGEVSFNVWEEDIFEPERRWMNASPVIRLSPDGGLIFDESLESETEQEYDGPGILARLMAMSDDDGLSEVEDYIGRGFALPGVSGEFDDD